MPDFTISPPEDAKFTVAPPKKFTVSPPPSALSGTMDVLKRAGIGIGESFLDIPREIGKQSTQAYQAIQGDVSAPIKGRKGGPPGAMDYAARAAKTALDTAFYGTGGPILSGAATSIVGRPLHTLLPNIPKEGLGAAVLAATPFAPEAAVKVKDGLKATEKLFSPTTVSAEAGRTERVIRRATGEGNLEAEKASRTLLEHNKLVGNLPVNDQRALIHYIEERSKGTIPAPTDPRLRAAADAVRKVYDRYKSRIQYILGPNNVPHFIQDYYAHLWKESPQQVQDTMSAYFTRQGTGRNLKQRTIPTIADGLRAGLTPRIENPIENTMLYARNMSRFLATHDIQNQLKNMRYAKWYQPGAHPKGWVPLQGIMTDKVANIPGKPAKILLYAPEAVARVYNNFVSRGFEQGDFGPFWSAARHLANGLTMVKLGLSAFHLSTMSNEGVVGEVARAISAASRGEVKTAAKALGSATVAPVKLALRGRRMGRELLDLQMPDALSRKINEQFVRSGGQIRMDPFYRTRAAGSFFNSFEKGTFARDVKDAFRATATGTPWERAKAAVDLAANVIQSVSAPLFERYIPAIKRGSFAARMGDFIRSNPLATQEELDRYAVKLNDSMDNRFGELVQDNLFWKRQMKQVAQIVLLSSTWDIGTIREIVGGMADALPSARGLLAGKGITDRTAYVAALAATMAVENGVATYLKTGSMPKGMDFAAYRTGGRDVASGKPERAILPSYEKDVLAFGWEFPHNIIQESINKLNPAVSEPTQLLRNEDYRGLPIYRPEGVPPVKGEPGLGDYLIEQNLPISINTMSSAKKGSGLSAVERAFGIRPAPAYVQDPERVKAYEKARNIAAWKKRLKADQKQKAREQ